MMALIHVAVRSLAVVALGLLSACGDVAGIPGPSVLLLRANLNELQTTIDRTVVAVDVATANKLEMLRAEAQRVLGDIEDLEQKTYQDAQKLLNSAVRDTHIIASDLRRTVTSSEQQIFRELDDSLAVLSEVLASLPLVDVRPYVAAIEPGRFAVSAPPDRLVVSGYLPGDGTTITAMIGEKPVAVQRTRSAAVALAWPDNAQFEEGQFVPVTIRIKERGWLFGFFGRKTDIVDRVRVARSTPLACTLKKFSENPEFLSSVVGDKGFGDEASTQAGAGRPSIVRTLTAKDLFTNTVSNFADYDLSTVALRDPGAKLTMHGACGHGNPSGGITSWGPDYVSLRLEAPHVGPHLHKGGKIKLPFGGWTRGAPWLHGGGGSKAIITFRPAFVAAKLGAQPLNEVSSSSVSLGGSVYEEALDPVGVEWSVHISCQFEDGDEKWSSGLIVLKNEDAENFGRGVAARVADGRLYVFAPDLLPLPSDAQQLQFEQEELAVQQSVLLPAHTPVRDVAE